MCSIAPATTLISAAPAATLISAAPAAIISAPATTIISQPALIAPANHIINGANHSTLVTNAVPGASAALNPAIATTSCAQFL